MQPDLPSLRVVFVAGTLGRGGAEQQLFYMAQGLAAAGASVSILSLTRGEYWEPRVMRLGVPVIYVGERSSRMARLQRIVSETRRLRPHIVQSQHFYTNLYAVLAARRAAAHDIGAIRNDAVSELRANGPLLGRLSLRLPRTLVANSQAAIRNAIALGVAKRRLFLLPNVVDTTRFSPSENAPRPTVRVLSVGRLAKQKRHDLFLRSLARVRDAGHPIQATIAGEGPLLSELQDLARRLRLNDIVEFAGAVDDMPAVYGRSDILVLSSDHEGTPNVVLEAMSCGVAVLATDVGDVPALIRNGDTGLLAAPGDEAQLAQQLCALVGSAGLRTSLGTRARAFIVAGHSPATIAPNLADIYRNVTARRPAGTVHPYVVAGQNR